MSKLPRKMIFGSFEVPRCQAKSKRSGLQCRKAAMQGKRVCRTHGGASTGPKTITGRQRCAAAKTVHGWETRAKRQIRAVKFHEMKAWMRLLDASDTQKDM